jgi:hypothetical protein
MPQFAHLFDAAIAGAVDFKHIDIVAGRDAQAAIATVARHGGRPFDAVQALGQDSCRGRFANTAGASKQIGVAYAIARNRGRQGSRDMLLADQLPESLWPITPRDNDVLFTAVVPLASKVGWRGVVVLRVLGQTLARHENSPP